MNHNVKTASDDRSVERCFAAMRELRPHLPDAADLVARVRRQREQAGYRLAYVEDDRGAVAACAGFRVTEFLAWGKVLYVDDLVTAAAARGHGLGQALMAWLADEARRLGCDAVHLDSGPQRLAAHRLYHKVGMNITAYHFAKPVSEHPGGSGVPGPVTGS